MLQTLFWFLIGLGLLIKGGDFFVSSSVNLARIFRIPRMIIGGTLVSLATTLPELIVTATASFQGNPQLAIGNAVGSVIANSGLIVGFTALVGVVLVRRRDFIISAWVMLGSALLLSFLILDGFVPRWGGVVLLLTGAVYLGADLIRNYRLNKNGEDKEAEQEILEKHGTAQRNFLFFLIGAVMVVGGSRLLVNSSLEIAEYFNLSDLFVGLTIIAIGTSLPELTTAIVSMRKKVVDLSLGNVVGANILGLTWVSGIAATINPFSLGGLGDLLSLLAMLLFVVMLLVMGFTHSKITRREGLVLILFYFAYIFGAYQAGFLIG